MVSPARTSKITPPPSPKMQSASSLAQSSLVAQNDAQLSETPALEKPSTHFQAAQILPYEPGTEQATVQESSLAPTLAPHKPSPAVTSIPVVEAPIVANPALSLPVMQQVGLSQNANAKGEFVSYDWQATPDEIYKSVRFGIYQTQALTSQAVGAVGQYRMKRAERALDGYISNKDPVKMELVELTQTRLETLQGLEQLVNGYNPHLTFAENKANLLATIDAYLALCEQLKDTCNPQHANYSCFELDKYYSAAASELYLQYKNDDSKARKLRALFEVTHESSHTEALMSATKLNAVGDFIRNRSLAIVRFSQHLNQVVSYGSKESAFERGDLHSFFEDAIIAIEDFQFDPHNLLTPAHQGHFHAAAGEKLTVNSAQHIGGHEVSHRALMGLGFLTGKDAIIHENGQAYLQSNIFQKTVKTPLKHTRATKWAASSAKAIGANLLNILTGLVFCAPDILMGLIAGIFGKKAPFLAELAYVSEQKSKIYYPSATAALQGNKSLTPPKVLLGAQIGQAIGRVVTGVSFGLLGGLKATWEFAVKQWNAAQMDTEEISLNRAKGWVKSWFSSVKSWFKGKDDDYLNAKTEGNQHDKLEKYGQSVEEDLDTELTTIFNDAASQKHARASNTRVSKAAVVKPRLASPAYAYYQPQDRAMIEALMDGGNGLMSPFLDGMARKHSSIWLVGMVLPFTTGALPFLFPAIAKKMAAWYVNICHSIGNAMSHGSSTFFSSAVTQGQLGSVIAEGVLHGPQSWGVAGIKRLAKNPADVVLALGLAYGFGLLIETLKIPFFSNEIRESAGNQPYLMEATAGGKFGIALVEALCLMNITPHKP